MNNSYLDRQNRHSNSVVVIGLIALLVFGGVIGLSGVASAQDATNETTAQLDVTVLNVGQADAMILETESEVMVIDTGDWNDGGQVVMDELQARNISHIDHLVATHQHSDHIGGHAEIINEFENNRGGIGTVYGSGLTATSGTYDDYINATETHNLTINQVREGDTIPFANRTRVLNPVGEPTDSATGGVVLEVEQNGIDYLFTGDLERDGENRLVQDYPNMTIDVLKLGHHGSNTSNTAALLDEFEPRVGLLSGSKDNAYGHPSNATLQRLDNRSIPVVWTATHGTYDVRGSDGEISVYAQNPNSTTDPLNVTTASATSIGPLEPLDMSDPAVVVQTDPRGGVGIIPDEPIIGGVPNAFVILVVALGAVLVVGDL